MSMRTVAACACAVACAWAVSADTVVFKSGARLTGEVVRIVGDEITFKSDDVGEVKIASGKVATLETAKTNTVQYVDWTTAEGVVALKDGAYTLTGRPLDMKRVKAVNPEPEAWHGARYWRSLMPSRSYLPFR